MCYNTTQISWLDTKINNIFDSLFLILINCMHIIMATSKDTSNPSYTDIIFNP